MIVLVKAGLKVKQKTAKRCRMVKISPKYAGIYEILIRKVTKARVSMRFFAVLLDRAGMG